MSTANILFGLSTRYLHDDERRGYYEPKMKGYVGYSGLKLGSSTRSVMMALNGPVYYDESEEQDRSIRNNIDTFWSYTETLYNGPGLLGLRLKSMNSRLSDDSSMGGIVARRLIADVWVIGAQGLDRGYVIRGGQYYLAPVTRKRMVTINAKNNE